MLNVLLCKPVHIPFIFEQIDPEVMNFVSVADFCSMVGAKWDMKELSITERGGVVVRVNGTAVVVEAVE